MDMPKIYQELMNLKDCRLYGIKSYNRQMFIQKLISLAYRDLLSNTICDVLMEINHFFRDIYSNKLQTQHMKRLKMNIVKQYANLI